MNINHFTIYSQKKIIIKKKNTNFIIIYKLWETPAIYLFFLYYVNIIKKIKMTLLKYKSSIISVGCKLR